MKHILTILENVKKIKFYRGTYKHQFDHDGGILTLFLSKKFSSTGEVTQLTYGYMSENLQCGGIIFSIIKPNGNSVRRSSTLSYKDETYIRTLSKDLTYNNLRFVVGGEIIQFDLNQIKAIDEDTLFQYGTCISNISEKIELLNYMFENGVESYTCLRISDTEQYNDEVLKFISNVMEDESAERKVITDTVARIDKLLS